jgi:3-deoxy-manno-octulosonate cytidylyltransferase (CMP-KDO synthetase)
MNQKEITTLAIIPARYESTRFPGKPLTDIGGKTMIQRVYDQAKKAMDQVVVATDDQRIFSEVQKFGGQVLMTSKEHKSGTDRCVEAFEKYIIHHPGVIDVVVNIQGDEPFIAPEQIQQLIECFKDEHVHIGTLVKEISNQENLFNNDVVKVVFNRQYEALYFSRSPIPFVRNHPEEEWLNNHTFYKHIGMYGYRASVLKRIAALKQSALELSESLEQNRWLENGYKIGVNITNKESYGIDAPEDIDRLKKGGLI